MLQLTEELLAECQANHVPAFVLPVYPSLYWQHPSAALDRPSANVMGDDPVACLKQLFQICSGRPAGNNPICVAVRDLGLRSLGHRCGHRQHLFLPAYEPVRLGAHLPKSLHELEVPRVWQVLGHRVPSRLEDPPHAMSDPCSKQRRAAAPSPSGPSSCRGDCCGLLSRCSIRGCTRQAKADGRRRDPPRQAFADAAAVLAVTPDPCQAHGTPASQGEKQRNCCNCRPALQEQGATVDRPGHDAVAARCAP
mmetsp:Transcript_51116/g.111899  ORF Transcript_51116/g.111899 Transcript_51116/m.111899 type:complete len:251 (-) Transcript_51116:44-796(-)